MSAAHDLAGLPCPAATDSDHMTGRPVMIDEGI